MSSRCDSRALSEITTWLSGGTPRRSEGEYWEGDIPWISGATLTQIRLEDSDRKVTERGLQAGSRLAPRGSTLVLVRGMSLHDEIRIGHAMRDVAFNQDVKALVPGDGVDPWFLTWALFARRAEIQHLVRSAGHGTGVLPTDLLKDLPIWLPSLQKQQQIAGVLGALDDLIDTNRGLAEACESLATTAASLSSGSVRLGQLADTVTDTVDPRGVVDHYSLPRFDSDRLPERVPGASIKSRKITLREPAALVSRLNPRIPRIWMAYPTDDAPALASTEFVWAACAGDGFVEQMQQQATGTTGSHQRVDKKAILRMSVPDPDGLPPSVVKALESLVKEAHASRTMARGLAQVRDELLPLLLSGRVSPGEVAA